MDFAGASPSPCAVRRVLGCAALVSLLVLVLTATSAQAQVAAPPSTAPGQTAVDENDHDHGDHDHDWDDDDDDGDDSVDGDSDWPGNDGTPPRQPGAISPLPYHDGGGFDVPVEDELPAVTTSYVAGRQARMRTDGKAAIPRGAPKRVRSLISQYNRIVGKRYKWGGGHAKLVDTGYDCSGAVGYGLIKGGLLRTTMVSGSFARWGAAGAGRWFTIYAHKSHVYIEVAGLRLDTSSAGDRGGRSGVRWRPVIGQRRGFKARHLVGL